MPEESEEDLRDVLNRDIRDIIRSRKAKTSKEANSPATGNRNPEFGPGTMRLRQSPSPQRRYMRDSKISPVVALDPIPHTSHDPAEVSHRRQKSHRKKPKHTPAKYPGGAADRT